MEQWQTELAAAVTSLQELEQVLTLSPSEREGVQCATERFRMKISPHILSLMDPADPKDPLKRQFLPSVEETYVDTTQFEDVTHDSDYSPVVGLVHKYPTKALLFPSNSCGSFCRFCFRRRFVGESDSELTDENIQFALAYIRDTPELNEIILSGGDPLTITDQAIEEIISGLKAIPHIRLIRIHTRLPISCPSRITKSLVAMLKKYGPIFMVVHINHPNEISEPTRQAFALLADNGIMTLSQTALLREVNDNKDTLKELWLELVCNRVKPYYLFHTDPVVGLGHFAVPISRGIEIMRNLYGRLSGLAYPLYCFNVPGGYGHVLMGYNYVRRIGDGQYSIETYDGQVVQIEYPENKGR